MAFLTITEFTTVPYAGMQGGIGNTMLPLALCPPIAEQKVAIGASSTQSAAFNAATRFVRLQPDAICSVALGTNPTVTAAQMRLPAESVEYFGVIPGHKLAVITNT